MMGKVYEYVRRLTVVLLVLVFAVACGAEDISVESKVVDVEGAPITGAKVTLFSQKFNPETLTYEAVSAESVKSGDEGGFAFAVEKTVRYTSRVIIAEKEGLAIGWANWYSNTADGSGDITLAPAGKIGGVVVDELGNPIAGAEVRVVIAAEGKGARPKYLLNVSGPGFLITDTDEQGRFVFEELPENAVVMFQASKAGKGAVITYNAEGSGVNVFLYSVGQTDIKITLADECVIEGKVIDKASQKPVEGIGLVAAVKGRQYIGRESVSSGEDKKDVEIGLEKGGVLEITVTEQDSGAVVEDAYVNIERKEPREYFGMYANKQGKMRKRLMPGGYQLRRAFKTGMTSGGQQEFTIESGKTTSLSVSMEGLPKVTGQVFDPEGKLLADAEVVVKPAG